MSDYLLDGCGVTFEPLLSSSGLTERLLQASLVKLVALLLRTILLFPKSFSPETMSSQSGCPGPGVDCTCRLRPLVGGVWTLIFSTSIKCCWHQLPGFGSSWKTSSVSCILSWSCCLASWHLNQARFQTCMPLELRRALASAFTSWNLSGLNWLNLSWKVWRTELSSPGKRVLLVIGCTVVNEDSRPCCCCGSVWDWLAGVIWSWTEFILEWLWLRYPAHSLARAVACAEIKQVFLLRFYCQNYTKIIQKTGFWLISGWVV